jgi:hypothetical protein
MDSEKDIPTIKDDKLNNNLPPKPPSLPPRPTNLPPRPNNLPPRPTSIPPRSNVTSQGNVVGNGNTNNNANNVINNNEQSLTKDENKNTDKNVAEENKENKENLEKNKKKVDSLPKKKKGLNTENSKKEEEDDESLNNLDETNSNEDNNDTNGEFVARNKKGKSDNDKKKKRRLLLLLLLLLLLIGIAVIVWLLISGEIFTKQKEYFIVADTNELEVDTKEISLDYYRFMPGDTINFKQDLNISIPVKNSEGKFNDYFSFRMKFSLVCDGNEYTDAISNVITSSGSGTLRKGMNKDNYYYYMGIIIPGEESKNIIHGVVINNDFVTNDLGGKKFTIKITLETIYPSADNIASKESWKTADVVWQNYVDILLTQLTGTEA